MIVPEFKHISPKKLIGKRITTTLANNQTFALWRGFMPFQNQIKNRVNTELLSVQVYEPELDFAKFTIHTAIEKWAAAEVNSFDDIPEGMESFEMVGGDYAVFHYVGNPMDASAVFTYIFSVWPMESDYDIDNRPHFEVLGNLYKNNDPNSEEDIWIPIKPRS